MSTLNPEWLELAQRAVSSPRRSPKQERVVAHYFETGPGGYREATTATRVKVTRDTVQTANAKLEQAGLLVREHRRKDADGGYFYAFQVPVRKAVNPMAASPVQGSQSDEQAKDAKAVNLTVEPNLQGSQSTPVLQVLATTSVVEAAKESLCTSERERDHEQIVKRLGPISESAFAALNAALDADRLGVIECVQDIERRAHDGHVSNPVGLLVKMLRDGEHVGKRPAPKICVYCGRPQSTAKLRRSGHVLCDHHHAQTTDGLLELAHSDHIATTGGVR